MLRLVAEGKTNKEIGAALHLTEKTVKNYVSRAFEKLQVSRRAQAAARFVRDRLRFASTPVADDPDAPGRRQPSPRHGPPVPPSAR